MKKGKIDTGVDNILLILSLLLLIFADVVIIITWFPLSNKMRVLLYKKTYTRANRIKKKACLLDVQFSSSIRKKGEVPMPCEFAEICRVLTQERKVMQPTSSSRMQHNACYSGTGKLS